MGSLLTALLVLYACACARVLQMYVLGGSVADQTGSGTTQISVIALGGSNGTAYTYGDQLAVGRSQFSAVWAPGTDMVAFGGESGASNEEVLPCPPGYWGVNCNTPSAAQCTYGYYRTSSNTCQAWSVSVDCVFSFSSFLTCFLRVQSGYGPCILLWAMQRAWYLQARAIWRPHLLVRN